MNWDDVLDGCDYEVAKREISDMFRMAEREAEQQGGHYYYPPELIAALDSFIQSPNKVTATCLLEHPEDNDGVGQTESLD